MPHEDEISMRLKRLRDGIRVIARATTSHE